MTVGEYIDISIYYIYKYFVEITVGALISIGSILRINTIFKNTTNKIYTDNSINNTNRINQNSILSWRPKFEVNVGEQHKSPKQKIVDLFNSFDRRISEEIGDLDVRMTPALIDEMRSIIAEAGEESPVKINGTSPPSFGNTILNGKFGVQGYADKTHSVSLTIKERLNR